MLPYDEFQAILGQIWGDNPEHYDIMRNVFILSNPIYKELHIINRELAEAIFDKLHIDIDDSWELYYELGEWCNMMLKHIKK